MFFMALHCEKLGYDEHIVPLCQHACEQIIVKWFYSSYKHSLSLQKRKLTLQLLDLTRLHT